MGIHSLILYLVLLLGLGHMAFAYPAFNSGYELETRDLPEAVEIDKRASDCISLEGLCQKNCMAIRNSCVAPVGILSSGLATCVENYEKCMAICPFFEGQCVDKRDPEVVEIEERAVDLGDRALSKKQMCDKSCVDTRRKCTGNSAALGEVPPSCQNYYDRCINLCSYLAPPATKRAAFPEPVILSRAVEIADATVSSCVNKEGLCNKNCAATRNACAAKAVGLPETHTIAIPETCETNYEICIKQCKYLEGQCESKRELPAHAFPSPDDEPCEKDAAGNCKNRAKVCVGGHCLAHLSHNSSTNQNGTANN